ncbi:hypothetical protein Tco_0096611 [Tanacetum coccineum]
METVTGTKEYCGEKRVNKEGGDTETKGRGDRLGGGDGRRQDARSTRGRRPEGLDLRGQQKKEAEVMIIEERGRTLAVGPRNNY